MSYVHLSTAHKEIVTEFYAKIRRTVDDLPYVEEFNMLHAEFGSRSGRDLSKHDFSRALSSACKASRLARNER